ncbi:MAG TPA: 2-amino-4-hydroxy-6-hydroxymethyldihydropteridine diphosphokinase [Prosthecochloris aestuarii]|uniref:2-amino-4-hydroxy-6-hydroxymethyldihydropteridine pyrophosphokinase n=1 Tax=Prosthecochloris aestuarii TaxID=1102 RepID=A0A831SLZ3_PROAE|nr:2-amino-4-hydroxy-6-hydroxymethyldihydropteridine diphosphokinase [Prosthecochloris aestuarii]
MSTHTVFIGAGSNIGDRLTYLQEACNMLAALDGTSISGISRVYRSDPVGITDQPEFCNIVIRLETELQPEELLRGCLEIEILLGRPASHRKWGPRVIDLDMLFYDTMILEGPDLILPHPELHNRKFVMLPMLDIADPLHPVFSKSIRQLLESCNDRSQVEPVADKLKNPSTEGFSYGH